MNDFINGNEFNRLSPKSLLGNYIEEKGVRRGKIIGFMNSTFYIEYQNGTTQQMLHHELKDYLYIGKIILYTKSRTQEMDERYEIEKQKKQQLVEVEEKQQRIIDLKIEEFKKIVPKVGGKELDKQQLKAVVEEKQNILVVAGAGTGKTLTIVGKVLHLIKVKKIDPSKILLITYTKKAAEEMKVRIGGELNEAIEIRTFHSLGLKILEKNKEEYFKLQENDKKKIYSNFFKHLKNEGILKNIIEFFSFYKDPILDISSFEKLGDYFDEIKVNLETLKSLLNEKETIQDEKVKSLEELMIANFLFYNGVKYEYEKEYEYNTKTKEYKNQYKPDFYLIDSKIYLEHFGITRDNRVPIVGKDQKKEKRYLSGKKWKINLHEEKGTRLLQTFSYFHTEGRLLEELEEMLLRNGVKLTPLTTEELKKLYSKLLERKKLKSVKELFEIFLNLYKSNNYLEKDIEKVFSNGNSKKSNQRMELFKKIFKEFYKFYEKEKGNKIDFTDMIINSKNMIKTDKAKLNYDYIIIDEYQDTSKDRFELIKAIQDKCNSKIMAVGDDWQSIYRFSGSDISLFIDFEKMFGQTKELKIEQTYRNSQELIKVASKFIQKNNLQKKKKLKSEKRTENPVVKVEYIDKEIEKFDWKTSQKEAVKYIIDNLLNNISNAKECSLMLIGRNNKDIDFLDSEEFKIEKNKDKVNVIYRENKNPRMKINFETVHKAKGLEADNVIILNCKNDYLGFPNKISDDPILDLLLAKKEVYPHAEERRLFYVALTRTKNKVFLLTPRFNPSIFLRELEALEYSLDLEGEENFYKNCPVCKTGNLVKREGYSTFYGCTNYPMCKPNINLEEYIKIK